ncbi:MAG: DUF1385 domain-containing protein [Clostridiales bacterium]|nr:DUF1385 domain-containing protein [Clostridiales bacterium]
MEGVMMRTMSGGIALAVRKADGTIETEYTPKKDAGKSPILKWPVVRGVVAFVDSISTGMKMMTHSAELYGETIEEEPSRFEKWLAKKTGKDVMDIAIVVAIVLAVALAIGLFVLLPSLVTQLISWSDGTPRIWKSLVEGFVRLLIFLGYISAISLMKDIRRVYMYHGAEHKTIACYEHDAPMTPESAMRYSRLHARCGTNYLFLVMAVSILFFAVLPYAENLLLRVLTRLIFLPLVAGLAYEVLKLAAASDALWARIIRAPGLGLQYLTTREPEPAMIEVAIKAFELAINDGAVPQAAEETAKTADAAPEKKEPEKEPDAN